MTPILESVATLIGLTIAAFAICYEPPAIPDDIPGSHEDDAQ